MLRPALIGVVLVFGLSAASCTRGSSSAGNSGFTGVKGTIAQTVNTFANDGSSNNATDICQNVLARAALARIAAAHGGGCKTIITNQLKTVDDFTVTIESISVSGSTAVAHVQTKRNGKKVLGRIALRREQAGWRIESFG